ncbi:MAG: hypothetical protein V3R87_01765 [Dehalococcoidia bacterium]
MMFIPMMIAVALLMAAVNALADIAGPFSERGGIIVAILGFAILLWLTRRVSGGRSRWAVMIVALMVLLFVMSNGPEFLPVLGALLLVVIGYRIISSRIRKKRQQREQMEREDAKVRKRIEKQKAEIVAMIEGALEGKGENK